jgi:hypothetical protein
MRLEGHLKQLDLWKDGRTPTDGKDYNPENDVMLHILKELTDINGKLSGMAEDLNNIRQNQGRS